MANKYRPDEDLDFLKDCKSADLDPLVSCLTTGEDGHLRETEEITDTFEYKRHSPNHHKYWQLIAAEFQMYAGHSFVNFFRGEGVLYKEALMDVCDKIRVDYNKEDSVELIETDLLMKIMTDSLDKMSPEELREITKEFELKITDFSKQAVILAMQAAIKFNGLAAYKLALIVANSVANVVLSKGLAIATNAGITKGVGVFAGPVGWAFVGLWTLNSITGTAYRVTIPCVIQIALLRAQATETNTRRMKTIVLWGLVIAAVIVAVVAANFLFVTK